MRKINQIQFLRAMAAIFVAISHVWGINGIIGKPFGFDYIGGFGVDIFFVISGFIMCYTTKDVFTNPRVEAISFMAKRVLRIYPIYLIVATPAVIYLMIQFHAAGGEISFYDVIGNILLLPTFTQDPDYHMYFYVAWSLCYEMMFYIMFSVLMILCKSKKTLIFYMVAIMFGMVSIVNLLGLQGEMLGWVNLTYMIGDSLMINFALGCVIYIIFSKFKRYYVRPLVSITIISLAVICGVILAQHQYYRLFRFGIPAFIIVLVALYTRTECGSDSLLSKTGLYLGNASYSIYLIHLYIVFISGWVYSITPLSKDVTGAIMSIVAVSLGCVFYTVIEKPINKAIHAKFYRGTKGATI